MADHQMVAFITSMTTIVVCKEKELLVKETSTHTTTFI